jgi:uncharacterized integral membrane protein (TIGR00697 family)
MEKNKALPLIAMAYVTTKLLAILLFYKVITLFSIKAAASTLIIPLWFCLGDVITEVYGYKIAKKLVWMSALCQLAFGWICYFINFLPVANMDGINQASYTEVAANLHKGATASFLAIVISGIINALILNKWKIKLKGNYFFMRSMGSTSIGEFFFTILVYLIGFHGFTSFSIILKLILISFCIKIIANPLMIAPISILVNFLKKYENLSDFPEKVVPDNNATFTVIASNGENAYFIDQDVKLMPKYPLGFYSKDFPAKSFSIRDIDEFCFLNWHTTRIPQYVIYLSGEIEIEVSHDVKRRFKSGDVVFFNDLAGNGHITRVVQPGQAVIIHTE